MQLPRGANCLAFRILAVSAVAMVAVWPATVPARPEPQRSTFRANSMLVLVPVTVVDRRGAIVNGLTRDAFTLRDDGVRQSISAFTEEDAPVSMGIVLDLSGSMKTALGPAKESLRSLLNSANPADEEFLSTVSTRPRAYSGFTGDVEEILRDVAFEGAGGSTALIDTIYDSLRELRRGVHPRKALVIISDGMDNHSRHSQGELLAAVAESDAQIYTIAVANGPSYAKPMELQEEKRGLLFLDEIAARTGGGSFVVHDRAEIGQAAASIGQALRTQYTIGYVPCGGKAEGKWHKITVKVASPGMRAYARAGYRLN